MTAIEGSASHVTATYGGPLAQSGEEETRPAWTHKSNLISPNIALEGISAREPKSPHTEATATSQPIHSEILKDAKNVVVVGWSSMGLGHTGRSYNPVLLAVKEGKLKSGDAVVVHIPVSWGNEDKRLSATNSLRDFAKTLESQGIKVAFFRSDKTIRADYKGPDSYRGTAGHSDNEGALTSLALQPYRHVPSALEIRWDGQFETTRKLDKSKLAEKDLESVPMVTAYNLVGSLRRTVDHSAANGGSKAPDIIVLDDMDPGLAKAGVEHGATRVVSQSNHANLFALPASDTKEDLQKAVAENRTYFTWAKMQYGAKEVLHSEISPLRNTLSGFAGTAANIQKEPFGITPQTSASDARVSVIKNFMDTGVRIPLNEDYKGSAGIFVADGKTAENPPKNLVMLYVQELTSAYGKHIQERMTAKDPAFTDTMFVICAAKSFNADPPINALQYGTFGNAGMVMAGGYGTTSEAWYAADHGHQGLITVMPVPKQREQETNAQKLKDHLGDRVTIAREGDWQDRFDEMVKNGTEQKLAGTMEYLFEAIATPGSNPEHTMKLMFGEAQPTDTEAKMNAVLTGLRDDPITRATARFNVKVLLPLLSTLRINGDLNQPFEFRMTAKDESRKFNTLDEVIETLQDKEKLSGLIGVKLEGLALPELMNHADLMNILKDMKDLSAQDVQNLAADSLHALGNGVSAGS